MRKLLVLSLAATAAPLSIVLAQTPPALEVYDREAGWSSTGSGVAHSSGFKCPSYVFKNLDPRSTAPRSVSGPTTIYGISADVSCSYYSDRHRGYFLYLARAHADMLPTGVAAGAAGKSVTTGPAVQQETRLSLSSWETNGDTLVGVYSRPNATGRTTIVIVEQPKTFSAELNAEAVEAAFAANP